MVGSCAVGEGEGLGMNVSPEWAPRGFALLCGVHIMLRRPQVGDAESIFREYACDREVVRFVNWRQPPNVETVREFLRSTAERCGHGNYLSWVLTDGVSGPAVGMMTCELGAHGVNIGYVLAR